MKLQKALVPFLLLGVVVLSFAACGGKAAGIGDLPVYTGAVELKAGDSAIGNTLANNTNQDAAMRKAMGAGGSTVQRGFTLPTDATWDTVKAFYEKELKASGWTSGLGGVAGGMFDVNSVMNTANQGNKMAQTEIFSKGKQTLTLLMTTNPIKTEEKTLILSLSTR